MEEITEKINRYFNMELDYIKQKYFFSLSDDSNEKYNKDNGIFECDVLLNDIEYKKCTYYGDDKYVLLYIPSNIDYSVDFNPIYLIEVSGLGIEFKHISKKNNMLEMFDYLQFGLVDTDYNFLDGAVIQIYSTDDEDNYLKELENKDNISIMEMLIGTPNKSIFSIYNPNYIIGINRDEKKVDKYIYEKCYNGNDKKLKREELERYLKAVKTKIISLNKEQSLLSFASDLYEPLLKNDYNNKKIK